MKHSRACWLCDYDLVAFRRQNAKTTEAPSIATRFGSKLQSSVHAMLVHLSVARGVSDCIIWVGTDTHLDASRQYALRTTCDGTPLDDVASVPPSDTDSADSISEDEFAERRGLHRQVRRKMKYGAPETRKAMREVIRYTKASLASLSTLRCLSRSAKQSYSQPFTPAQVHNIYVLARFGMATWLCDTLPHCSAEVVDKIFANADGEDRHGTRPLVKGTALHLAVISGDDATVEVVARSALRKSPARGHWIKSAGDYWRYDAASSLDLLDERADTPLVLATCAEAVGSVSTLLELRASIDGFAGQRAVDAIGSTCSDWVNLTTPLEIACVQRSSAIAKLLITQKADVRPRGSSRCTSPLLGFLGGCYGNAQSIWPADLELARGLIAARADVNFRGRDGKSALFYAVMDKQNAVIPLLLQARAEVNAASGWGDTPLHIACSPPMLGQNAFAVPLLLEYRADPAMRNCDGRRASLARFYQRQRRLSAFRLQARDACEFSSTVSESDNEE